MTIGMNELNGNNNGHSNGIHSTAVTFKEIPPEARLVRELRNYYNPVACL